MQTPTNVARAVLAAPAFLLLVATCLAAGIRGGESSGSFVRGDRGVDGAASADVNVDIASEEIAVADEDELSLERRHRSHHPNRNDNKRAPSKPQNSDSETIEVDSSFDFYVYSMSYQPEFCRANGERFAGCKRPDEAWEGQLTIHGLWPNREDGTWPAECTDEAFDLSLLSELSDDLAREWPNVKAPLLDSPGHESFWAHEWTKHGTCSGLAQQDYFLTALDLLLPTPAVVKENYGSTVPKSALEKGYGGADMTAMVCKGRYLSEVRVCFEKMDDGAPGERVTCPGSVLNAGSCGESVEIARFAQGSTLAEA